MEYVTITKAAELLGVSRPTIYRMIADGELRMRQFVGRPAIALTEIQRRTGNGHKPRAGRPKKV